jgi:hypothetical protein
VTPRKAQSETEVGLEQLVEQLTEDELREVLTWAAEWHEDVERRVRLTARGPAAICGPRSIAGCGRAVSSATATAWSGRVRRDRW